jgi:ketosteroid isomerase-like protein
MFDRGNRKMVHDDDIDFSDIRCSGNLVVIQFIDKGHVLATGKRFEGWAQHINEFENGRLVRGDTLFDTQTFVQAFT